MTTSSVRMMKEFRLVAWPAAAVTSCAVIALVMLKYKMEWGPLSPETLTAGGFFAGLPVLAGLGIGSEFQYRTLVLNLAQPLERDAMWRVKNLVALAVMALPAALFCFGATSQFADSLWMPLLYVVTFSAAAFPMTLVARSTIGGAALNALATCPVFWGAVWITQYLRSHDRFITVGIAAVTLFLLAYSVAMVWLGRRMFLRLQAAEGMQSVESVLPGAGFVPAAIADWFRCRPSQMFLNLVRREFRLLRLIWPLALLSIAAWTALIALHIIPIDDAHPGRMPYLALAGMISGLIALLCGSLSLGEERTWGTHDWQLTLPVSPSLQWFVKLSIGLALSVLCGALLPMSVLYIGGRLTGNGALLLPHNLGWLWSAEVAALTLATFWCACLVKSTARASMLVVPLCALIAAGAPIGTFLAEAPAALRNRVVDAVISIVGVFRAGTIARSFAFFFFQELLFFIIVAVVLLGMVTIQSHRLFREQVGNEKRSILRNGATMFMTMLLGGMFLSLFFSFCMRSFEHEEKMCQGLNRGFESLIPTDAATGRPLYFRAAQISSDVEMSAGTRRWLAGAKILIVPDSPDFKPVAGPRASMNGNSWVPWVRGSFERTGPRSRPYAAVLTLADGSTCAVEYRKLSPVYAAFDTFCR